MNRDDGRDARNTLDESATRCFDVAWNIGHLILLFGAACAARKECDARFVKIRFQHSRAGLQT